MNPADVTVFNAQDVWRTLYGKQTSTTKYKFKVGDQGQDQKVQTSLSERIPPILDRGIFYSGTKTSTKPTHVPFEGGGRRAD